MRAAAFVLLGIIGAGPALAQGAECSFYFGVENLDADDAVALGRINKLAPRTNFVKSADIQKGCPNASAACRDKAYLVPGDEVVVIGSGDAFVCASYTGAKGQDTEGFLPRAAVTLVQNPPPAPLDGWIGQWRGSPEQEIVIAKGAGPDSLKVTGDATYGALDPERVKRGAVNLGSLDGEAALRGGNLSFAMGENGSVAFDKGEEYDCKVRLRRLGPYLLVKDNTMCGGMNVTFTGIYRRR
jgi:hypothetical protein